MSKIEDAVVDFITNKGTFFASLLSQMKRTSDPKGTETMKVSIENGRVNLFYNPDFIDGRTMKDTKAILEHECLHIVMEHHARFKKKDHQVAKIATDLAINQLITNIPKDAITILSIFGKDAYNVLRNESAEYYYDKIMQDPKLKKEFQSPKCMIGTCGNDFKDGDGSTMNEDLQKEIIKQMVKEAVDHANKTKGKLPAGIEKLLDEMFKPPKMNWRQLLRKFVSNSVKAGSKASWKKPSRRYGDAQKGRIADRTVSLVVVIDTSGSINDGMLSLFIDEIKGIQSCYKSEIHMIECDAEVGKYYKLKHTGKVDRKLSGRGGTSFKPPIKYVKEKNIRCDAMIYFTDLCGDFPDKKPPYPMVWAYYDGGWSGSSNPTAPFGHVITLEKEKQQ